MKPTLLIGLCMATVLAIPASALDAVRNHQLYYQQDPRVPMTSVNLVFHGAGAQQETEELAGLARMTARMLFRGTAAMTREAIQKRFELLGADVSANTSETDFTISISCFSKSLDEVLSLVATILREAEFPQNEFEIVKRQELNTLDASLQDPDQVLSKAAEYVVFGGQRFGKFGSRKAIGRVTREDLRGFIEGVRGCAVLYFTAITDIPKGDLDAKLDPFKQNRPTAGFTLKPEVPYKTPAGRGAIIISSPGATNDRLLWSHPGIAATDERRFDLELIIDALGSSQGFLFDQLRNKNGWCYGAYAFQIRPTLRTGRISYYSDPTSTSSEQLIPEMLRLIATFKTDPDFQARLGQRNSAFKNRYAYQLDLRSKLNNEVNRDRYDMPILSKDEYLARIDAVNFSTAAKVIDGIFQTNNIFMVFYGDAERITSILSSIDPGITVNVLDKTILVD